MKNLYNGLRSVLTVMLLGVSCSLAVAADVPEVQGTVSLCKSSDTEVTVYATSTFDESTNTVTFITDGLDTNKYFNFQYTVDDTTYFISASSSREITAEGVGYQVKAGSQVSGTSFHLASGISTSDCVKIVLNATSKTVSAEVCAAPLSFATSLKVVSSSTIMSNLTAENVDNQFVFTVANTGNTDTKSFALSYVYSGKTYYVVPAESEATTVTSEPIAVTVSTETANFKAALAGYKFYELTVDAENSTISIKEKWTLAEDETLTFGSNKLGTSVSVNQNGVSAVDGVYTFDLKATATDTDFFYFTYGTDNAYCIRSASSSDRNVTENSPKAYSCYTSAGVQNVAFKFEFAADTKYRLTVDTNNGTVTIVAVTPQITGTLTMINANDATDTRTADVVDGQCVFSNISYDTNDYKYFYFKYTDVWGDTYYVYATDSSHKTFDSDGKNTYAIYSTTQTGKSFQAQFATAKNVTLDLNNNIAISNYTNAAGVDSVEADDADAPAVYYNLQGVRVANPENGIYIRVRNNKAEKVVL